MIPKKLKNRYNVIIITFLMLFVIVILRVASLMIVEGEEYRELSENRIFKNIPLTAPRGEIRDRYGRLLAGNRPSFTVQIMKNEVVDERINEVALDIVEILEKNGDRFVDEFPIIFCENQGFEFIYDIEISEWKYRHDIHAELSAKEVFEVMLERYGIEEADAFLAQQQLLKVPNLNVPISIRSWKFIAEMKKEEWLEAHRIRDFEISAYDAFHQVKNQVYRIPESFSDSDARKIMVIREQLRKQGFLQYRPVVVAHDISRQSVIDIEENIYDFPGVNVVVKPVRYYPHGELASHVIGFIGKISQQHEIDKFVNELGYRRTDLIGKTGIEHSFELNLKGEDGFQEVIVDSRGRLQSVTRREEPVIGDTIYLTIDLNLQIKAEKVLEEVLETIQVGGTFETQWGSNLLYSTMSGVRENATSASVVVTDVRTGEVLVLANYPAFDPNLFATGISTKDWKSLKPENERDILAPRPLANIALSTAVQPGSTYKMIVGLAALEQGMSEDFKILDRGFIEIGNRTFGNWLWNQSRRTMGRQNIVDAIADSNNFFFYSLGAGFDFGARKPLPFDMDIYKMLEFTHKFGLNDRTGIEIDVPRERSGGVPSIENKLRTTKTLLARDLRRRMTYEDFNLEKKVTDVRIEEIIEEILSWTEDNPSRGTIVNRLLDFGFALDRANVYTDIIKFDYFNFARWTTADTLNFSIGQGEHAYTPLQMNKFMEMLANGGYRFETSVLRKIRNHGGEVLHEFEPQLIDKIEFNDEENLEIINHGMYQVNESGTARRYFAKLPIDVAGKTGTAQKSGFIPPINEVAYLLDNLKNFNVDKVEVRKKMTELTEKNQGKHEDEASVMRQAIKELNPNISNQCINQFKEEYDNFAWYTGFAPYQDPEIAISVLIFQGGSGGFAAPIFREIVAEHMGLNLLENEGRRLSESVLRR
ncbi:MAG: penicillin-binding transpeptidase domain-containing protein [Alkaliphilus sp.]